MFGRTIVDGRAGRINSEEGEVRHMIDRTRIRKTGRRRISLVAFLVIILSHLARAQYLDPGSGSFLFQAIVAGLTILIFFFSRIRHSLKRLTLRLLGKEPEE